MMRRVVIAVVLLSVAGDASADDPYQPHRNEVLRALRTAQQSSPARRCPGFDAHKVATQQRWVPLRHAPTPPPTPIPTTQVAARGVLQIGKLTIAAYEPGRLTGQYWGVVSRPGAVQLNIPARGAPSPRSLAVLARSGTRLVVWGGVGTQGMLNDGGVFDLRTGRWQPMAQQGAPTGRARANAVWLDANRLFIWGGGAPIAHSLDRGLGGTSYADDGGIYDLKKKRWSRVPGSGAPSPRTMTLTFTVDNRAVLVGGWGQWQWPYEGGARVDDLAIYDAGRHRWSVVPVTFWNHWHALQVQQLADGSLAVYDSESGLFLVDARREQVQQVPLPPGAEGRQQATFYGDCDGVVIFGGKRMVDPGGGCENHRGPGGCDPVGPTYVGFTDGWRLRAR
jgi:hypothetical protein